MEIAERVAGLPASVPTFYPGNKGLPCTHRLPHGAIRPHRDGWEQLERSAAGITGNMGRAQRIFLKRRQLYA